MRIKLTGYDPNRIANRYNRKATDENDLNVILARDDGRFFNHSGIICQNNSAEDPRNEEDMLDTLHKMEIRLITHCLEFLGRISRDDIVLEAGCGAGGTSIMIHEAFGCHVEGFDLSMKQVERAKKVTKQLGYDDYLHFEIGDMLHLPRPNQFYDAIIACESSEHLPDLNPMFAEFQRLAKYSSSLMIIAWCSIDSPRGKMIKSKIDDHYLTSIHTCQQYVDSANKNSWKLINRIDLTHLTLPYWTLRNSSPHKTGSEAYFCEGYSTGNLEYSLLTFIRE